MPLAAHICGCCVGAGAHPAQHKRLAAGDAAGVVSCWDAQKGRLLAAATAHIGPVATCRFTSGCSSGSGCPELVSCGSDGCVAFVQVGSRSCEVAAALLRCSLYACAPATTQLCTCCCLQVDDAIRRLYAEGFSSLYQHCKKSTKVGWGQWMGTERAAALPVYMYISICISLGVRLTIGSP